MDAQQNSDFLTPGIQHIRKSIRDIDDSYNHAWDLLAELCQNAVDAIRATGRNAGEISVLVDAQTRTIQVSDDGIGIDPSSLPDLLKPFSTNKETDETSIGEKGVGLTFVMFSCNYFRIRTGTPRGAREARIRDALNWKSRTDNEALPLELRELDAFSGTEVTLEQVDPGSPIFSWSFQQLAYVLRTRTALGNTLAIWDGSLEVKVSIRHKAPDGQETSDRIPFNYWLPQEGLASNTHIDLDDFVSWANSAERTDADKRRRLQDRLITYRTEFVHSDNRKIRAFACYVPKRQTWKDLTARAEIASPDQLNDQEWLDNFDYLQFRSGIFTSVKGMPTGIEIGHPSTGYAGYWSNFFMLFEDSRLSFDIGRKSIHGRQASIYRKYARDMFNHFLTYVTRYVSGEVVERNHSWDRDQAFADIDSIPDLNLPPFSIKKTPKDQEAGVAALFYEAIGRGVIAGITPLVSGYRNKYDVFALVGARRVVLEFKSRLSRILRDFDDERKMFDEIDAVIAWDVSEDDIERFLQRGIALEEIESRLSERQPDFPYATHQMRLPNVNPVYVLDLKRILRAASTSQS